MKSFAKVCLALVTALTMAAYTTHAQTTSSSTSTNTPAKPKSTSKKYTGTIASVDSDAKTITVTLASGDSQTLKITSKTKIRKDGEAATLADAAAGQKVQGYEHKNEAGDWVAGSVIIGNPKPKAAAPPAAAPAAPADK
jgi:Cu/Ag efflux protein CusF